MPMCVARINYKKGGDEAGVNLLSMFSFAFSHTHNADFENMNISSVVRQFPQGLFTEGWRFGVY